MACKKGLLLPIGPKVVPFWGSYNPKKELLWGLWVIVGLSKQVPFGGETLAEDMPQTLSSVP